VILCAAALAAVVDGLGVLREPDVEDSDGPADAGHGRSLTLVILSGPCGEVATRGLSVPYVDYLR
jgi:hypothetical protein